MNPQKNRLGQIQNGRLSTIIYFDIICPIFDKQETESTIGHYLLQYT